MQIYRIWFPGSWAPEVAVITLFLTGFLASAAKHLDAIDTMVKLGNILDPYLSQKLVQMNQSYLILANVQVRRLWIIC